ALNDGPQATDRSKSLAAGETIGDQREFERPGNPDNRQFVVFGAMPAKGVEGAVEQPLRHQLIEPGYDDGVGFVPRDEFAFNRLHSIRIRLVTKYVTTCSCSRETRRSSSCASSA